jgi:hypothetical protein
VTGNVLDLIGPVANTAHGWDGPDSASFTSGESDQPNARPLLVQDPGRVPDAPPFLARCRRCGWTCPRQPTPGEALAAFAAHTCQERLA